LGGGGDLNFTLHRSEIWGESVILDNLANFFLNRLEVAHLVDVEPMEAKPTWSNNRVGVSGISKRLDMFLIHEDLLLQV
jgi:hypothetical protein